MTRKVSGHFCCGGGGNFEHYMNGTPFISYSLCSVRYIQGFSNPTLKLRFKLCGLLGFSTK